MLNVYTKFDNPTELSLYDKLNNKIDLLSHPTTWSSSMDLKPILHIIAKTPRLAYAYAVKVLDHRFPEGEPAIMRDPEYGYKYAKNIIKGRFPEAEPGIMEDSWYAKRYAEDILSKDSKWTSIKGHENGRWPDAEPIIMKDPEDIISYARDVIGGRWIEAEPHIKQSTWWIVYKAKFGIE